MLYKFIKSFKERVFPVFCVECGREGEWWCADCLRRVDLSGVFCCPLCGRATARGKPCPACAPASWLDGAAALLPYTEDSPQAKLIQLFKYNFAADIQRVWEALWRRSGWLAVSPPFSPFGRSPVGGQGGARGGCLSDVVLAGAVIMPVPLHKRRERERGYNQAAKIAEAFIAAWGSGRLDVGHLVRSRATVRQVGLSRSERLKNVQEAFRWEGPRAVAAPAEVILVDDVFTTGATMQECARVLKAAGARRVYGLTLARG